jgi:hypothetical protein
MERDKRNVTSSLARRAVNWLHVTPEELPVGLKTRHDDDQLATDLGTLGYPGYSYRRGEFRNPAEVLLDALDRSDLDARLVEALPWLPLHYPEMNWDWLTSEAKLHNRQNRLGFVVSLSRKVAKQKAKHDVADQLTKVVQSLEDNRLAKTDTLCQESWPPSQRQFVHKNRSRLAAHWNLDTRLTEQSFAQFTA